MGESPKNLAGAFRFAEAVGAILFFDEADAFLGKRIANVSQGSEQAINSMRSQMLVSLDRFKGVVIFATNFVAAYDPAFGNRMHQIEFKLPGPDERTKIWQRHLPANLPISGEIDYLSLSVKSDGFSGRDIKNTVLQAIANVLINGKFEVAQHDLLDAIEDLKRKQNSPGAK